MHRAPRSLVSRVCAAVSLPRGAWIRVALATTLLATTALAADPLEPRMPWSPGGWTPTNWLGFALYVSGFLLVAALILRLGAPPAREPDPSADRVSL